MIPYMIADNVFASYLNLKIFFFTLFVFIFSSRITWAVFTFPSTLLVSNEPVTTVQLRANFWLIEYTVLYIKRGKGILLFQFTSRRKLFSYLRLDHTLPAPPPPPGCRSTAQYSTIELLWYSLTFYEDLAINYSFIRDIVS